LRSEAFHPEYIGPLSLHIRCPHVHGAFESVFGGHGGGGHAVLARPRLRDHSGFSHAFHQEPLPHDIIGLVGAGMVEVFSLDIDFRPAEMMSQIAGKGDGRGPAGIGAHDMLIFLPEGGIRLCGFKGRNQFLKC